MYAGKTVVVKIKLNCRLADVKSAVENIVADCEKRFWKREPDSLESHISNSNKVVMPDCGKKRKALDMKSNMQLSENMPLSKSISSSASMRSSLTNSEQRKVAQKKPTRINNVSKQLEQQSHKGVFSTKKAKEKTFFNPCGCLKGVDGDMKCRLNDLDGGVSSTGIDSKGLSGRNCQFNHASASKMDCRLVSTGTQDANSLMQINGNNSHVGQLNSHPAPPTKEVSLPCLEQISPTKALRAAMLKSRFAATILKAQNQLGEKVNPTKLQEERDKLEKKQLEEKARIEAQAKAKEEAEARKHLEMERQSARLALLQIEKTAEADDYFANITCPPPGHFDMSNEVVANFIKEFDLQYGLGRPLEKLGLFIKKEDFDEEIDKWSSPLEYGDIEEGEI